ncbi:conserved hypothetical protein [Flavobacterium sp. 9AF]|uniref:HYC_CC_PP family protein n=1 Tax=Flavobacterium sp. 9AF TaxID=2653142 RepID=UPI0012EF2DBD|nr:hypothetical protein [Flavobacterium sp. 9AF]VXB07106.1 conserved hypothetical protein [Flavobacterium sp. 9AF]
MSFRKNISILLAFVFLFSNLGFALNVHYCHDKLSSISIDYQFKDACVEEDSTSCCASSDNHSECCSNKIVEIEKKTDNTIENSFQFVFDCPILFSNKVSFFEVHNEIVKPNLPSFYCDSNAPPFYKLYCQLVFYA